MTMVLARLLLLLLLASEIVSADVTVKTNGGYLTGFKQDVKVDGTNYRIAKFLGIPYAQPPVGRLRFRRPQPLSPYKGHLMVKKFKNRCVEWFSQPGGTYSEDCLYLNIVVPDVLHLESLAVMVYIHGGSFTSGSANDYNVDLLAALGRVIIVTVNYRITAFGFLSTDNDAAEGNYGLWDQHMAIRWVHDNIRGFGGDTGRVTIFGESAGAASVIYQGLYPGNRGLFQRIIAQSGSASMPAPNKRNPKEKADQLAKATGCYNESVNVMIDCLRFLPLITIVKQLPLLGNNFNAPVIDNNFVACEPRDLLNSTLMYDSYEAAREMFASVELITGFNSNEGGLSMSIGLYGDTEKFLPNSEYFVDVLVPSVSKSLFGDTLDSATSKAVINHIIDEYTKDDVHDDPHRFRDRFIDINSDALFIAPIQQTVSVHANLSPKSTYLYYFNADVFYHVLPTPSWLDGANHADDLAYIFPPLDMLYIQFDSKHKKLARTMITMWTNFAKTGDPNQPNEASILWKQYSTAENAYLEFTVNMTAASMKKGFPENKAYVWNTDLPAIIATEPDYCDYVYETSGVLKMQTSCTLAIVVLSVQYCYSNLLS